MMKEFTDNKEFVRYDATQFVTWHYKACIVKKYNLRNMFISEEWVTSKWVKEAKAKRASDIILMSSFWNLVVYILKVMDPLVRVFWLTNNENKPTIRYIYEVMNKANEMIQKYFYGKEENYKKIFTIIDKRYNCQLNHSLHIAWYYLNSEFFYKNTSVEFDAEIINGLYQCIVRLVPNLKVQDKIIRELSLYKNVDGLLKF